MTTEDREALMRRIRRLLDRAADAASTDGEVAQAMAAARRLMDEHHVSEADVEGSAAKAAVAEPMAADAVPGSFTRLAPWESSLGTVVAEIVGTAGSYSSIGGGDNPAVVFYGATSAVEIARAMYATLAATIKTRATLRYGGAARGNGRAYAMGFVSGIYAQVREQRRSQQTAAIVLQKQEDAQRWLEREHGVKLTSRPKPKVTAWGAYSDGKADGRRHDISHRPAKAVGSASQRALA